MPKIEKLPSGNYRVRVSYKDENGRYRQKTFTADTKDQAYFKAMSWKPETDKKSNLKTVGEAVENYLKLSEILSPNTLKGYGKISEYAFADLKTYRLDSLTDDIVQKEINKEAKRKSERTGQQISAKTVINEWSLMSASIYAATQRRFNVKLPKYQKHIKYYPDPEVVVRALIGTDIELPGLLAAWMSFSVEEIRGLMYQDLHGNELIINRVRLSDTNEIKENAKEETRLRKHIVPKHILDLMKETDAYKDKEGFFVPRSRAAIYGRWKTICKQNGISGLSFHDLRHYSASIALMLHIPDKYTLERGGWKTDHVLKSVYQHTFTSEREMVDATINQWFDDIIGK